MVEPDLPPGTFADPERGFRNLQRIHEDFIRSGSRYPVDQFSVAIRAQLLSSPDAGMALTNLIRFADASVSKASLFNDLVQYPIAFEVLMRVFGFSQYFSDILVREPGLFRWLTTSSALMTSLSRDELGAELHRLRETFVRPDRRLEALKRLHRREMLRIGAQDLLANADLPGITQQLSELADMIVNEVVDCAVLQLEERYGKAPGCPFAVIGLGKLGGGELNYSSDIDVMFVYGNEGEFRMPGGATTSNHEYFVRLSERIVRNLSQPTAEGHLYRVDARLRPESGSGPLARSVSGYLTYYESRGELWERQMLLKARPIAGDITFGNAFLRQLDPFVYPRSFLQHPAESIIRIKSRIEAAIGEEANVKLMRGGIRDVEFIAQALQMIHAGRERTLRERNTLRALSTLTSAGLLDADDEKVLREAYLFFRTLEHRLQTVFNTQTHVLPSDDRARSALARRTGFSRPADLMARVKQHAEGVRKIFDHVLEVPAAQTGSARSGGIVAVLDGGLPEATVHEVLARYGFRDLRSAARHLRILTTGSAMTEVRELDSRSRDMLRTVAPQLFSEIGGTPVPDITLAAFATVVAAQKFPAQMYAAVQERGFRTFILQVCSHSPRFARGLAMNPLVLEELATNVGTLAKSLVPPGPAGEDLATYKQRQELRAAIRYLLGFSDIDGLTDDLSAIADRIVTAVMEEESVAMKTGSQLAVFALGKFGTREITFDADLDMLFIADASHAAAKSSLERLASRVVKRLTASSATGRLYDVDARLRPEGKNAPLVIDTPGYEKYLGGRVSLWERQSLTRLRPVCGAGGVIGRVKSLVETFVYGTPLPEGWIRQAVDMRRKTEARSRVRTSEYIDVKLGAGGMLDIEFLVQLLQLSTRAPGLRGKKVREILATPDLPFLTPDARAELTDAYGTYRRIETLLRMTFEERVTILPEGERLERLARFVGHTDGAAFSRAVHETMKRVRMLFLGTTAALAQSTGDLQ